MTILSWQTFLTILVLLPSAGALLDRFWSNRQKALIYDLAQAFWVKLADTKIPDIPRLVSTWMVETGRSAWGKRSGGVARTALAVAVVSFILTTIFSIVGALITEGGQSNLSTRLPFYVFYLINFVFDFLTLAITYYALCIIMQTQQWIGMVTAIADACAALLLFALCWASCIYASDLIEKYNIPSKILASSSFEGGGSMNILEGDFRSDGIEKMTIAEFMRVNGFEDGSIKVDREHSLDYYLLYSLRHVTRAIFIDVDHMELPIQITLEKNGRSKVGRGIFRSPYKDWYWLLVAGTTAIPTIVYLFFLLLCYCAKFVLFAVRVSSMHFLELLTDKKPTEVAPFALLGAVADLMLFLVKLVAVMRTG